MRFSFMTTFLYQDVPNALHLDGCADLAPAIETVTRRWPHTVTDTAPSPATAIPIVIHPWGDDGFSRTSPWTDEPSQDDDAADALVDIVSDLIDGYLQQHPDLLCLHGAALEIDGGLVLFANVHRSGKSLFAVQMAALGARLFSDDVVPLTLGPDERGIALGLAPRLRLPLPDTVSSELRAFIDAHDGVANDRYGFVGLPDEAWAAFGDSAPVRAIVVLERHDDADDAVTLSPLGEGDTVKRLIERNITHDHKALDILERLHTLAAKATCLKLRYRTVEAGARHLMEALKTS